MTLSVHKPCLKVLMVGNTFVTYLHLAKTMGPSLRLLREIIKKKKKSPHRTFPLYLIYTEALQWGRMRSRLSSGWNAYGDCSQVTSSHTVHTPPSSKWCSSALPERSISFSFLLFFFFCNWFKCFLLVFFITGRLLLWADLQACQRNAHVSAE